jgi:hypothetical protein
MEVWVNIWVGGRNQHPTLGGVRAGGGSFATADEAKRAAEDWIMRGLNTPHSRYVGPAKITFIISTEN